MPAAEASRQGPRANGWHWLLALALLSCAGPPLWNVCFGITYDGQNLQQSLQPPSWAHPCGTDFFGRDVLVRVCCGLRMSFAVGLCGASIAAGIGTAVGLVAGLLGGAIDAWLMRAVDVLYALPFLFLAILLVTLFGQQPLLVFAALGAVGWLTCARMVRAHVLAERGRPYVEALRLLGASRWRIACMHVLPNSIHVIAAAFAIGVPAMVLEEAFLSFLGLGVQPPHASLGSLVGEGASLVRVCPWPLLFAALAMAAMLWTLNACARHLQARATAPVR